MQEKIDIAINIFIAIIGLLSLPIMLFAVGICLVMGYKAMWAFITGNPL